MSEKWMSKTTPEKSGISSNAVSAFIRRVNNRGIRLHSFMLLRDNQVAAEAYWSPFTQERPHRAYSISKSFTSVAIGLLEAEGKLSLDDSVAGLLPDRLPKEGVHPYIKQATVRDLLRMATPHSFSTFKLMSGGWVESFFRYKPTHPPGAVFAYDTSGTHVLGAIVERLSGMPLLEYLRMKVLDEIGFSKDAFWLPDPYGVTQAGSGLCCLTRDLARFGLLCMNHGRFEDKQLIPEAYIRAATTKQIDNSFAAGSYVTRGCGYGYQFWCGPDDVFACYGMAGQYIFASPSRRLMVVTTADTQIENSDTFNIIDAIWEEIFEAAGDTPLPEDKAVQAKLEEEIKSLTLLTPCGVAPHGGKNSSLIAEVSGKRWLLRENSMGISQVALSLSEDNGTLEYLNQNGKHVIEFGWGGDWREQLFTDGGYECAAAAAWADDNTLEIWVCIMDETPATLKIKLHFSHTGELTMQMQRAVEDRLAEYNGFAGSLV